MGMAAAEKARRIFFKSKGGTYSAIFMSDTGDLFQQYTGASPDSAGSEFYPKYSAASPANLRLTIASARSTGTITPASVTYRVAGIELAFNASGACTTATKNMNSRFRLSNGVLQVIGNLADIASGSSFIIEAEAKISSEDANDSVVAHLPVSVSPYTGGESAMVTIAPGDSKNFTISTPSDSVKLMARVYIDGNWVSSGYTYEWYRLTASGWGSPIQSSSSETLTVTADMVDTYADFRVVVKSGQTTVGSDTQGVIDVSDPFDIITSIAVNKTGTGTAVSTNSEELTDEMPDSAYLQYTCSMVTRGSTTALTGVTWNTGSLISADGLKLQSVAPSANVYRITVAMLKACGGVGEYEFVFGCSKN